MAVAPRYQTFLRVRAEEDTTRKAIADLRFEPTASTALTLANHQLLFRGRVGGFDLSSRGNPLAAGAAVATTLSRIRLVFSMHDGRSLRAYEPGKDANAPAFYFDNLASNGQIVKTQDASLATNTTVSEADCVELRPSAFDTFVPAPGGTPSFSTFTVTKRGSSSILYTVPVAEGSGEVRATRIVLEEPTPEPGPYTLHPSIAALPRRELYIDASLRHRRAIGVVELHWELAQDPLPLDPALSYRITFKPPAA